MLKKRLTFLAFVISQLTYAQVYVENPQYFEWDTNIVQFNGTINNGLTRILSYEEGLCVLTRKYRNPGLNSMTKELHFFDSSSNYISSVEHGEVGNNISPGVSEDFFYLNGFVYVFDFQSLVYSLDSLIEFHCFSKYNLQGNLLSSDTLWGRSYYPFFAGNANSPGEPIHQRYVVNDTAYYVSLAADFLGSDKFLVKCNLIDASISLLPFNLGNEGAFVSFLGVDENSFLIEKKQVVNSFIRFSFERYNLSGLPVFNTTFAELNTSFSTRILDYVAANGSIECAYRRNSETDRYMVDFMDENLNITEQIDIHGDEYDSGRLIYPEGSQKLYLVLLPRLVANYNYRLVEIDIQTQSIVFDTTFDVSLIDFLSAVSPSIYVNHDEGDFISYGVKLGAPNRPYFHRINVFERRAYLDSIVFPLNETYQYTQFINIDYNEGTYHIVGLNPSETDDELNAYCLGTLSIPTSIKPSPRVQDAFRLFPNPAQQFVSLSYLPPEDVHIELCDVQGRVLHAAASNGQTTLKLPIEGLSAGVYFVSVRGADGLVTRKFIKN